MNRMDVEDSRRRQLIGATIDTIAEVGFSSTTLALIGQRAGVSAGLISHYFEDKDGLLEATLRTLASRLAHATTERLRSARTPRERVQAVIDATLAPEEFDPRTCGVWLAFWGQVIHSARLNYHLCHFEVPSSIARVALSGDAVLAPFGGPGGRRGGSREEECSR